jgi:hypothetical protein
MTHLFIKYTKNYRPTIFFGEGPTLPLPTPGYFHGNRLLFPEKEFLVSYSQPYILWVLFTRYMNKAKFLEQKGS